MEPVIEVRPKCDEFYADNVRYLVPKRTPRYIVHRWVDRYKLRHAMLVVKRLFKFKESLPRIEDAHTVELIECDGEYYLRIRMDS